MSSKRKICRYTNSSLRGRFTPFCLILRNFRYSFNAVLTRPWNLTCKNIKCKRKFSCNTNVHHQFQFEKKNYLPLQWITSHLFLFIVYFLFLFHYFFFNLTTNYTSAIHRRFCANLLTLAASFVCRGRSLVPLNKCGSGAVPPTTHSVSSTPSPWFHSPFAVTDGRAPLGIQHLYFLIRNTSSSNTSCSKLIHSPNRSYIVSLRFFQY